jgi:hypothetical protein
LDHADETIVNDHLCCNLQFLSMHANIRLTAPFVQ